MKKIIVLGSLFFVAILSHSQILPTDYPFKTYVDHNANLYVTGSNGGDIFFTKYNENGNLLVSGTYSSYPGIDKGMDIVSSLDGNLVFIVGYLYNSLNNPYDVVVLKYDVSNNQVTLLWDEIFDYDSKEDKGLGIAYAEGDTVYVCGFATNSDNSTDYLVIKYNPDGSKNWDETFSNSGNEVAMDLLVDDGHVYLMGFRDEESDNGNRDIMLVSYDIEGNYPEQDIVSIPGSDEIPTSFVFTDKSHQIPIKSKAAIIGYIIKQQEFIVDRDYIAVYFGTNLTGDRNTIDWTKTFGTQGHEDIGTSIISDENGNVIVTGYYHNGHNGTDFGTLKYDKSEGDILWGPVSYDYDDGIDQASSI